jgi:hypothetical protein
MRNLGDSLRKLSDQILADATGTPDRPTSLYAAGTVGGLTPRRTASASGEASDTLERDVPMPTGDVERRRPRPAPAPQRARVNQGTRLRVMLRSPQSLRTAIVVSEVLGPPVALRDEGR